MPNQEVTEAPPGLGECRACFIAGIDKNKGNPLHHLCVVEGGQWGIGVCADACEELNKAGYAVFQLRARSPEWRAANQKIRAIRLYLGLD
ncbi:MAG: hypothetical protein HY482_00900 [Candidatus Wildermuthbacteria bacterium]|nr:hypothetical protein [Candidatus Wildermuthbacteria bacterium]